MARVVLVSDVELEVTERDPAALTGPAAVDELLPVGEQSAKRRDGPGRRCVFEFRDEVDLRANGYSDRCGHGGVCKLESSARDRLRSAPIDLVLPAHSLCPINLRGNV